jgi:hypothetical protein
MADQIEFLPEPSVDIPQDTNGPNLWIKRLVIVREPGDVIRDVELHPGLNIVWSADEEGSGGEFSDYGDHGVGKTLFCRLLRYCLGERRFAPTRVRLSRSVRSPS